MKRLITSDAVAEYLKISDTGRLETFIPIAESIIAQALRVPTIHARHVIDKQTLIYAVAPDETVQLRDGPLAVASEFWIDSKQITLDSSGYVDGLVTTPWTYQYAEGFSRHMVIKLGFTAGYTPETLPSNIRDALIVQTALIYKNPQFDVVSERIGDYSISRLVGQQGIVPAIDPKVSLLLRGYGRPSL